MTNSVVTSLAGVPIFGAGMSPMSARLATMMVSPFNFECIPMITVSPGSERMVGAHEFRACPYSFSPTRRISIFGLKLLDYLDEDRDFDLRLGIRKVLSNEHGVYLSDGFGFSIYEDVDGIAAGTELVYSSRVFLHDRTARISVDSDLPILASRVRLFRRDFRSLMKHLVGNGLNPKTTSATVLYGVNNEPSKHADMPGMQIAKVIAGAGLQVNALPIFDGSAQHFISLSSGEIIGIEYPQQYIEQLEKRRQSLGYILQSLEILCEEILDIGSRRVNGELPGVVATLIDIIESQYALLPNDRRSDIDFDQLDSDDWRTVVILKQAVERLKGEELLVHAAGPEKVEEWEGWLGEYAELIA